MRTLADTFAAPKDALGPFSPAQAREHLSNITNLSYPAGFPVSAVLEAVSVADALADLGADSLFVTVGPRVLRITWPVEDVDITIEISQKGSQCRTGVARTTRPRANISMIMHAIDGAQDVARFRNMMRTLEKS